jgi:hypothetical protein
MHAISQQEQCTADANPDGIWCECGSTNKGIYHPHSTSSISRLRNIFCLEKLCVARAAALCFMIDGYQCSGRQAQNHTTYSGKYSDIALHAMQAT